MSLFNKYGRCLVYSHKARQSVLPALCSVRHIYSLLKAHYTETDRSRVQAQRRTAYTRFLETFETIDM